jgi:hypothetical protein
MWLPLSIERMRARGVRRAPVVSNSGDLVGMVSLQFAAAAVNCRSSFGSAPP